MAAGVFHEGLLQVEAGDLNRGEIGRVKEGCGRGPQGSL